MNELFLAGYEMGALRGAEWLLASGAVEEVPITLHGKVDQSEMSRKVITITYMSALA